MTVCIAAIAGGPHNTRLILCADWRVSSALGRSDTKFKLKNIGHDWHCLTSGEDTEINAVTQLYRTHFGAKENLLEFPLADLLRAPLADRKRQKLNEYTIGKFGIDYDTFLSVGRNQFPPELFREAMTEMSNVDLEASFILAGFRDDVPWIFRGHRDCRITEEDGFATVGEGAYLAQSVLLQRAIQDITPVPQAAYIVYEAKRAAEQVGSVGEYTTMIMVAPKEKPQFLTAVGKKQMEEWYEKFKAPEVGKLTLPDNAFEKLAN